MKVSARVTVILNAQQRMVPLETHSHACWQASEIHFQVHSREPVAEDASPLHVNLSMAVCFPQSKVCKRERKRGEGEGREGRKEKDRGRKWG